VSVLDRMLLAIFALGVLCASVIVFVFGIDAATSFQNSLIYGMTTYPGDIYTIVLAIVFVLLALRFLFYRTGHHDLDYVMLPGDDGQIRISYETIRELSNRTGRAIKGVQELETRVRQGQAGVMLGLRVRALADIELADMSQTVQTAVKAYVEKTAGVVVERITVHITEIANKTAKSARAWVD
jgi:uncharacterized alkaline shock family protein YloU